MTKYKTKTRRGNNEGSIFQRKDGRWAGSVTLGYDADGKINRKTVYGKSKMEVINKINKLSCRLINNTYEYLENRTIGEMMKEWLLLFKKIEQKPRTFDNTIRNFRLHIEPVVGNMKIEDVSPKVIQTILMQMIESNYNSSTVKKVKYIFNQFFDFAVDNKYVQENPVKRIKVKYKDMNVYQDEDGEEYKAIPEELRDLVIETLKKHKLLSPLCMVMLFSGIRIGEALALRYRNIKWDRNIIDIQAAITQNPKFDKHGNKIGSETVVSDTKTVCSVREVPMPDILIDVLQRWKRDREQYGLSNNLILTRDNDFVFGNNDGSVRTYSGTKKILERFLVSNNLKKYGIHFHSFRQTFSNILFENGVNPKVIQALLGHKSVKTTIANYDSVDKNHIKAAVELFNNQHLVKTETTKEIEKESSQIDFKNLSKEDIELLERLLQQAKKQQELAIEIAQ